MATARRLNSGAEAHVFTPEERAKGGRARAEKMRERREAAQAFADGELQAVTYSGGVVIRALPPVCPFLSAL